MKTKFFTKLISLTLMAVMLLPTMLVMVPAFAEEVVTYVLDVGGMPNVSSNTKIEGDTDTCGDDNFFTAPWKSILFVEEKPRNDFSFSSIFVAAL